MYLNIIYQNFIIIFVVGKKLYIRICDNYHHAYYTTIWNAKKINQNKYNYEKSYNHSYTHFINLTRRKPFR